MRPTARQSIPALLALLLAAGCGKPVTVTVIVEKATLLAEPKPGAAAVGEALPGKPMEAKAPGLLGAKGFYRVSVGDRTAYLSEEQAAPFPLPATPVFVQADAGAVFADRALSQKPAAVKFGAELQICERASDAKVLTVVENGIVRGWVPREATIPPDGAAERLAAKVFEAARAGDLGLASVRAHGLAGPVRSPRVEELVKALAELAASPAAPGGLLRTGSAPAAGARAYVIDFTLPAYATDKLSGAPSEFFSLGEPVEAIEVSDEVAKVRSRAAAAAEPGEKASPGEAAEPDAVFVDARALQLEPLAVDNLRALAQVAAKEKRTQDQLLLLARASFLDPTPAAFEQLFDAAVAAGEMRWAAWAAQRGRLVDLVIWETAPDARTAEAREAQYTLLAGAVEQGLDVASVAIDPKDVPGLEPGAHPIAAGACREGDPLGADILDALTRLSGRPPQIVRVRLPSAGPTSGLRCPRAVVAATNNDCQSADVWTWSYSGDGAVALGKRTLRGVQFDYRAVSHCEGYSATRGVLNVFFLVDGDDRVVATGPAEVPKLTSSYLPNQFDALQSSVKPSGKGLAATYDMAQADCITARLAEIMREGRTATVRGDQIVVTDVPSKRVWKEHCEPPTDEEEGD
jgi:hypothetical protein